jgi:hypothetical protein
MPYFVYRIERLGPVRRLESAGHFDDYNSAAGQCRRLRADEHRAGGRIIRMIFAETALHAEELLSEVREPEPAVGDDY